MVYDCYKPLKKKNNTQDSSHLSAILILEILKHIICRKSQTDSIWAMVQTSLADICKVKVEDKFFCQEPSFLPELRLSGLRLIKRNLCTRPLAFLKDKNWEGANN